jgi:hypothetical protein
MADGRFGCEADVAGPAAGSTRSLVTRICSTRVINTCRLIHEAPYTTLMYRAPIRQYTASIRSHVKVHRLLDALE